MRMSDEHLPTDDNRGLVVQSLPGHCRFGLVPRPNCFGIAVIMQVLRFTSQPHACGVGPGFDRPSPLTFRAVSYFGRLREPSLPPA